MSLPIAQILLANATSAAPDYPTMTGWSWLYMLIVWAAIIALNVFCFGRIFTTKK